MKVTPLLPTSNQAVYCHIKKNIARAHASVRQLESNKTQASHLKQLIFWLFLFLALFLTLCPKPSSAGGVFGLQANSGADNFAASFTSVDDTFDQLTTAALQVALPSYVDTSAATADINFRGLEMNFQFNPGSPILFLSIPSLNISEQFSGATRDESKDLLVAYLEGDGADTVDRIQRELARVSPSDPIAGNPTSLMSTMVAGDFDFATSLNPTEFANTPGGLELLRSATSRTSWGKIQATAQPQSNSAQTPENLADHSSGTAPATTTEPGTGTVESEPITNTDTRYAGANAEPTKPATGTGTGETESGSEGETRYASSSQASDSEEESASNKGFMSEQIQGAGSSFGIDVSHAQYDLNGDDATTETITFEYQYQFKNPSKILRIRMPLAVTDTEGSKSYDVNLGAAYSHPITKSWTLTPGLSYGVGGSEDLGGGASINGYSLVSSYRLVYGDYFYNIGNMIGHYATGSVSLGDYEINPDISNTVFRNGLVVMRPVVISDMPTMFQIFGIDTRFNGDELFTEHYYELGFAMGLITEESLSADDTLNFGLTYLDSTDSDIKGYKINFGFKF